MWSKNVKKRPHEIDDYDYDDGYDKNLRVDD